MHLRPIGRIAPMACASARCRLRASVTEGFGGAGPGLPKIADAMRYQVECVEFERVSVAQSARNHIR